jgi:hypothetical protein
MMQSKMLGLIAKMLGRDSPFGCCYRCDLRFLQAAVYDYLMDPLCYAYTVPKRV